MTWDSATASLGDYSVTKRIIAIAAIAVAIGVAAAYVASALLWLIALFTNIFFFQRFGTEAVSPAAHHMGPWVILVPAAGGLIIGPMARYGSDKIRGHGIPEALEAILIRGSRVEPRVAVLKPLSAAVSIGAGGPFGAEGPIIVTGGALGSLVAQFFHLTSAERKTLLVAGSAAGMSAIFNAPLSAVALAVELLLFEWKPRSVIPVALASATAAVVRAHLLGAGSLFTRQAPAPPMTPEVIAGCVAVGAMAGLLAWCLTQAVYASEDAFARLPIHWMWWPAIGGLAIGVGGWLVPGAFGVGYDIIGRLIEQPQLPLGFLAAFLAAKAIIWIVGLGSGTSGGVLAPLLLIGGALGGLEGSVLPQAGAGFWPLVSMGAILGGAMGVPITGVIFAMELTGDMSMLVPLLIGVTTAYAVGVLTLRRSILTEKISRRGYHLSREYAVDPLEILFVREVVRTAVVTLPAGMTVAAAAALANKEHPQGKRQRLYPVVTPDGALNGIVTRADLIGALERSGGAAPLAVDDIAREPVVALRDEPLRSVVYRMAQTGVTRFPVVDGRRFLGMVGLNDLLTARAKILEAEQRRDRIYTVPRLLRTWIRWAGT